MEKNKNTLTKNPLNEMILLGQKAARFISSLHLPNIGRSEHFVPFEHADEPMDGLWTSNGHIAPGVTMNCDEQPELWEGLPYYHGHE